MSWASPPEQVQLPPPAAPVEPSAWRPRGPAVVRTLAATVLVPAVLYGAATFAPAGPDEETLADRIGGGYFTGATIALAALALILWALVAQARTRPAPFGGVTPGNGVLIAAVLTFGLSAFYLVAIPLAIIVFLVAGALAIPALLVVGVCTALALLGLANARGGHTGPTQRTATLAATAGWTVVVVVMPVAGGVFVLSMAG